MRLHQRAPFVCVAIGVLALALRLALLPWRPIPLPAVHDEFAYLLGAETFCLGRVTNPPHPLWIHFETFHENFQPTYASKYPPAQSLFLALGWKLFGHPWYGVWLSCGLMCGALCWMLQGWVPPRYALLGGLMAVTQWGVTGYWIDSYWGGAVAAAAGALVIGAVPRLARRPTTGVAVLAAVGSVWLANCRPYEGFVTVAGAAIVLLYWRRHTHRAFGELFAWRIALPVAAVLLCGAAAMLYYNYRVTGNALRMPYALHQARYGAAPIFWLAAPVPAPVYNHDVIAKLWLKWDKPLYDLTHAAPQTVLVFFAAMLLYFLTPVSAAAIFLSLFFRRSRKVRLAAAMLAISTAGLLLERFPMPHYFAPATGILLLLILLGVQVLGVSYGGRAVAAFFLLFVISSVVQRQVLADDPAKTFNGAAGPGAHRVDTHQLFAIRRHNLIDRMEKQLGKHLIIVRYAADHDIMNEWVYNHADIDGAKIVWARDMGAARNRELLEYYRDREIWLLDADDLSAAPIPYPAR